MTQSRSTSETWKSGSLTRQTLRSLLFRLADDVDPQEVRSITRFAEEEFRIPDGPFKGLRFDRRAQPFAWLWLSSLAHGMTTGCWRRFAATGPTQSGKSLVGWVIPALYHLFERGETVICGVPTMDMAKDKWQNDLLPAIEASPRFREMLPKGKGEGSRGGDIKSSITFTNSATLRFMTGGGSDKSVAGFTSRVVIVTETDGMDVSGGSSREADRISQLEARTHAWGKDALIYLECTVSIESGRIWQEYQGGTRSRISRQCPHCSEWVTPGRESLIGWQEAESESQAGRLATWSCPECDKPWTEEERVAANRAAKVVHRGQVVGSNGAVEGPVPDSKTFSLKWDAVDNHFWEAADVGAREWLARNEPDEENSEKKLRQFTWALPYIPQAEDLTALDPLQITKRGVAEHVARKGFVPAGSQLLTVGIDLGKWLAHWVAIAWRPGATPHVVDYGIAELATKSLGVERATVACLWELREMCEAGWRFADGADLLTPKQVWIDSGWGYQTDSVYAFCEEPECQVAGSRRYFPTKGFGDSESQERVYRKPKKTTGSDVLKIGHGWHMVRLAGRRTKLIHIDADHWKTWLSQRLSLPVGHAGALTLYHAAAANEHLQFARHLAAEKQVEEFVPGVGLKSKWEQVYKQNHWLDGCCMASAAANYCGVELIERPKPAAEARGEAEEDSRHRLVMPDGRPFLITER